MILDFDFLFFIWHLVEELDFIYHNHQHWIFKFFKIHKNVILTVLSFHISTMNVCLSFSILNVTASILTVFALGSLALLHSSTGRLINFFVFLMNSMHRLQNSNLVMSERMLKKCYCWTWWKRISDIFQMLFVLQYATVCTAEGLLQWLNWKVGSSG